MDESTCWSIDTRMLQTLFILPSLQYIKYICFIPILTLSFFFQESARRIGKVSEEAKLEIDEIET